MRNISDWETFVKKYEGEKPSQTLSDSERKKILDFFANQKIECVAAGCTFDEISREYTEDVLCSYRYGVFRWDSRDILYFEKYNMPLFKEFVDMVLKKT